jgi:hypothetical protein
MGRYFADPSMEPSWNTELQVVAVPCKGELRPQLWQIARALLRNSQVEQYQMVSATISMAPQGHSSTHIPQPLQ